MPYGIITDVIAILVGGVIGGLLGKHIPEGLKKELNHIIGAWAMTLGIALIPKMQSFGAVMISIVVSYCIGYALDFNGHVNSAMLKISDKLFGSSGLDVASLSVLIVLVTFGGSGIAGAMAEAISGDRSIILGRAAADLFTALLFGAGIGPITGMAAIPACVSLLLFFLCAKLIMPLMTDVVYANFVATGGFLTLIGGLAIFGVSKAKPMNAVLSVLLIIPITMAWIAVFG